jgi:tetratricopeptide (TPR) repeat protein
MRRISVRIALATILGAGLMTGCGGGPKPKPTAQQVKKPAPKVEGVPPSAVSAFNDGVSALQASPADYKTAATHFEKATKSYNKYVVAWINLGYAYEKLGRNEDAANVFRKVISELRVTEPKVKLALGRALLLSGSADAAIVEFESVLRELPKSLEARNNLAAAYLAKGDRETALRYVKEVLAAQPKNVPAIINLGLLYQADKKLLLAELMFKKALSFSEENQKTAEKEKRAEEVVAAKLLQARAHNNMGLTYYDMENIPGAVLEFKKALALDPTMDEARLNVASIYLDYLDYAAALEEFQKVRERFPQNYVAMIGAADAAYGTADYENAAKLYTDSLEIRDDNAEALLRVGKIYEEQLGEGNKALGFYKKYRSIANPPANHPIHSTIQFLEQEANKPPPTPGAGADDGAGEEAGDEGAEADTAGADAAEGGEGEGGDANGGGAEGDAAPADEAAPEEGADEAGGEG